jgi:hypothetical protein
MPVSPQDFALWSRMTGNPMPGSPAEQMMLAPQVFQFNRQLAQGRNPLQSAAESISSTIDTVGKTALGLGLATGATLLGVKALRNLPDRGTENKSSDTAEDPLAYLKSTTTSSGGYIPTEISSPDAASAPRAQQPAYKGIRGRIPFEEGELIPGQSETVGQIPGQEGKTMPGATTPGSFEDLLAQAREHTEGYYERGSSPEQAAMSELAKQKRTADRASIQEAIGMFDPGEFLGKYTEKLQLDDEPHVDNDVVAAEPISQVANTSKDLTESDPASDINQRVLPAQTQEHVLKERSEPQPPTVAENLATQQSPVHSATKFVGKYIQGAQEKAELARRALGNIPFEQAMVLLGGKPPSAGPQPEATAQTEVTPASISVAPVAREVKTASFSTNPYLSAMSQAEGPSQTYGIDPKRSRAISEMTFYPGGELGVELKTKGGPKDYVYAMTDPYREALGEYAAEGFPSGMGQIGRIATPKATGVQTDVQLPIGKGGVLTGGESKILFNMTPESKEIGDALAARAAARETSVEEGDRATFRGSPAAAFLKKKAIETIGKIAESPV